MTDNGITDKNRIQLVAGDVVTTIYPDRSFSGNDGFDHRGRANIILTKNTLFYEAPLLNGTSGELFEMTDIRSQTVWSEMAHYTMDNYAIYTQ